MLFMIRDRKKLEARADVVLAPTAYDAIKFMAVRMGIAPGQVEATEVPASNPNVMLEWRGHDAGQIQGRFLWCCERPIHPDNSLGDWEEWRRCS